MCPLETLRVFVFSLFLLLLLFWLFLGYLVWDWIKCLGAFNIAARHSFNSYDDQFYLLLHDRFKKYGKCGDNLRNYISRHFPRKKEMRILLSIVNRFW